MNRVRLPCAVTFLVQCKTVPRAKELFFPHASVGERGTHMRACVRGHQDLTAHSPCNEILPRDPESSRMLPYAA